MTFEYDDPMWGRLTIDRDALLDALGKATKAVGEAHSVAVWKTNEGYPVNSAWGDALFGINSTIDALIDLLDTEETFQTTSVQDGTIGAALPHAQGPDTSRSDGDD